MSTLEFDTHGHLVPYDLINADWVSFAVTFGWNDYRRELIQSLESFINKLGTLSIHKFTLWIDGSFVTKKSKPNDLDVVFIIPSIAYRQHEAALRLLRDQFDTLDTYFVRMIDESDDDFFLYISDRTEWIFQFTMTKPDRRTRRKYPKGFLQIVWNNESAS